MATGRGGKRPGAGRPKGSRNKVTQERRATVRELAEAYAEEAMDALVSVARSGSDAAKVSASVAILDRAFGRPAQSLEVSGPDRGPIQTIDPSRMSTEALAELLAAMNAAPDPHA